MTGQLVIGDFVLGHPTKTPLSVSPVNPPASFLPFPTKSSYFSTISVNLVGSKFLTPKI